ncbi:MAG: ATP-dependent DNA helicase, partial [Deltaproteobacteria bacterium]|nr:ATP-dependent DNA helicase [Deltaproteobacteria bacterium]
MTISTSNSLVRAITEILEPNGRLARAWPDYESRPGQLVMARDVARAFETSDVAIIEAGTGTGKTLAYLIPALLSRKKTVVSTGTKNLQEQIFYKDIPFIRRHLGSAFKAAFLKGRENYLCLYYFERFLREPVFAAMQETVFLNRLVDWAQTTSTGDRAELTDLPEDFRTWSELSADKDRCLGGQCPKIKDCFLHLARKAAAAADLVVVNHHLFMADLMVRAGGVSEVIPGYQAVIFDEAHQMEDVATQHFGVAVSSWRLAGLKRDTERSLTQAALKTQATIQALTALGHQADALMNEFTNKSDDMELWTVDNPEMDRVREQGRKVVVDLDNLAARLEALPVRKEHKDEVEALVG